MKMFGLESLVSRTLRGHSPLWVKKQAADDEKLTRAKEKLAEAEQLHVIETLGHLGREMPFTFKTYRGMVRWVGLVQAQSTFAKLSGELF